MKVAAAKSHRLVHDADGLNTAMWPVPANDLITPTQGFFTRSHAPIPRLDPHTWRLQVEGLVERAASFSLAELRRTFPQRQVTATLVCAGLRRNEFLAMGPLPGELPWGPEPASTGRWTGVSLGDVLRLVGVTEQARHVEMVGLDQVERHGHRFGFGGSIDLSKALGNEVLLASELNGSPLPPEHGFPLRVVVPGWIGARSVKWLGRITLLDKPSGNYFQSQAYRTQRQVSPRDPRDVSRGVPLSEVPVNSVILQPTTAEVMPAGETRLCGWAMGSGGRALTAVEVSPNNGKDWMEARIVVPGAGWAWSLWKATLDLPRGRHILVVRATDTGGAVQPPDIEATWNVKGYNNNAWHRVTFDFA